MTDKERELVNGFGKIGSESGRQGGGGCLGQFVFYVKLDISRTKKIFLAKHGVILPTIG